MATAEYQNLGNYLQAKRIEAKLTQAKLAQLLKIHVQYVSNWERGVCAPPSHCFQKALDILKVDRQKIVAAMVLDSKIEIEAKVFRKNKLKSAA